MHCLTVKSYLQIETDRFMSLVVLDIFSLMKNYLMLWDKKKWVNHGILNSQLNQIKVSIHFLCKTSRWK